MTTRAGSIAVMLAVLGGVPAATAAAAPAGPPVRPGDAPHETGTKPPRPVTPARIEHSFPLIDFVAQPAGFRSVQVNVTEGGLNTVGDAANEPSIAVDPTDPTDPARIVIGWRQFDTIASDFREAGWAYSHDGGECWTSPGVLEDGVFRSDPVLQADRLGNIYYYSLFTDLDEQWRCDMFISDDRGVTWTGPIFAYGGDKAWMAIDATGGVGDGHVYSAWNAVGNVYFPAMHTRSVDGGFAYMPPIEIPEHPKLGTVDIGPNGEMYLVGLTSTNLFYLLRSDNARDAGQVPVFDTVTLVDLNGVLGFAAGPNPQGLLGQAWVAVDRSTGPTRGNVYVLASVEPPGDDPLDVYFARSTDGGVTFSPPVRVNDDPAGNGAWQWFGTMSVAPNGRLDVIWNDTRNDPLAQESELFYAYSLDAGATWSANAPASPPFNHFLGYPQNEKLGDYYDMVSDDGGAHVAYAATFNGEQDVYYTYVAPPPPPLAFAYPDGRPGLVSPHGQSVRVEVSGQAGAEAQPGTGRFHYDPGDGPVVVDMIEVDENVYDAVFPSLACGAEIAWHVSAQASTGETVTDPLDAPGNSFTAVAAQDLVVVFQDDFEEDLGWTVTGDASGGSWERGTPATGCDRGSPLTDADGSGQCYLTGIDTQDCDSDVDGGTTRLVSPALDATDPRAAIFYWRWYYNPVGGDPDVDVFTVEVSDDDGATWAPLETVGPGSPDVNGGWFRKVFAIAEVPDVESTDSLRLRFSAADLSAESVIEAGIDGVAVRSPVCGDPGDVDGDGEVDAIDLILVLASWGDCAGPPTPCHADLDGDGSVTFLDLLIVLLNWG